MFTFTDEICNINRRTIKHKRMKKLFLTFVCAAFAAASMAGEPAKKPSFKGFVSNGFWDNWELSVGVGVNYNVLDGFTGKDDFGKWSKRTGWMATLSGAKWFHPVVGVRAQLEYGESSNFTSERANKYTYPFFFGHVDAMINFSNWVGGYREDRVYYAVPFAGFGYQAVNFSGDNKNDGTNQSFAFTAGLLNKFRVCDAVDINLELKAWLYSGRDVPAPLAFKSGQMGHTFSATVGVTYRFNKRDFERGVPGYTAEDIRAFQDAVAAGTAALAAAEAANERLAEQVKATEAEVRAAKAETAKAVEAAVEAEKVNNAPVATTSLYYDYSASQLTSKDKTRLQVMAELIKNGPSDRVYKIEGHADQATGTKAGNRRVAENRAKNVYNYLIKCGVDKDQLTYEGLGNDPDIYPNIQKANRTVIIK